MGGVILFVLIVGVLLIFKALKPKTSQDRFQAHVNRAATVWNNTDTETRVLLLRNTSSTDDPQLFQAYVQSPYGRLPEKLKAQLVAVIIVYEETPSVLR